MRRQVIFLLLLGGLFNLKAQAQSFPSAECTRVSSQAPCAVNISPELISITPSGASAIPAILIQPNQVLSYDYFRKSSEDDSFASGYHRSVIQRLAKNYSYIISWKSTTGNSESLIISLNNSNSNKIFYPIMRRVTGLELGIARQN